ncbi:MAG TPA: TRAP transporter TatT component family protein [Pyrinomonadaceae bacterium]|nr:TRAP transporter TatT component family protein [Pyrinomonadaceae bacterium]
MDSRLEELTRRADALYDGRGRAGNVRASVPLLEEAADEYEAAWRMGRALFFLGQEAQDKEETRAHHARGVFISERAARLAPRRVEGHFWLGVNLALLAQTERPLKALRHALRARRSLVRAARLDPTYHAAGPLRVLARLQHKLPRLAGGGTRRARANFERAVKLAPANTVTRLYFAEMLLETGDTGRARAELEALLNAPHEASWAFESERDRERARRMLGEMERRSSG